MEITTREDAIRFFLARAAAMAVSKEPMMNFYYRRPCRSFHPQIYIHERSSLYDAALVNPLADFIRNGKPAGPWCSKLIEPSNARPSRLSKLKVALHVHFHYPELCSDFLAKMGSNSSRCDLLLSTTSEARPANYGEPSENTSAVRHQLYWCPIVGVI